MLLPQLPPFSARSSELSIDSLSTVPIFAILPQRSELHGDVAFACMVIAPISVYCI